MHHPRAPPNLFKHVRSNLGALHEIGAGVSPVGREPAFGGERVLQTDSWALSMYQQRGDDQHRCGALYDCV